jgi:hypothetical protein
MLVALIAGLSGCAGVGERPVLLHDVIKKGDRIQVAKPIEREPFNRAIYFQAGEVRSWWGADVWRTQCRLLLGEGVRSEGLDGSEYEVVSIGRSLGPGTENVEVPTIYIGLRTINGSLAEELRCERWRDYLLQADTPSDITLADFEDAVDGYLKIVGRN